MQRILPLADSVLKNPGGFFVAHCLRQLERGHTVHLPRDVGTAVDQVLDDIGVTPEGSYGERRAWWGAGLVGWALGRATRAGRGRGGRGRGGAGRGGAGRAGGYHTQRCLAMPRERQNLPPSFFSRLRSVSASWLVKYSTMSVFPCSAEICRGVLVGWGVRVWGGGAGRRRGDGEGDGDGDGDGDGGNGAAPHLPSFAA